MMQLSIVLFALALFMGEAEARNQPCSGSKGGVSHCIGAIFVCRNGTTSQSKRSCSMAGPAVDVPGVGGASGGKAKRRR